MPAHSRRPNRRPPQLFSMHFTTSPSRVVPLSIAGILCALIVAPAAVYGKEVAPDAQGKAVAQSGGGVGARGKSVVISSSGAGDIEMVDIPGGSFQMGCSPGDNECGKDEYPRHAVKIKPFRMSRCPVTFALWDACVISRGCGLYSPSDAGWGRGNRPVINVSWDDAQLFIDWMNRETGRHFRLPSEAEWEYAARAGTTTRYYWGDNIGRNHADCDGCGSRWDNKQTAPVNAFRPNAFGLFGMLGNVKQWTEDCWNSNYNEAPDDGSALTTGDCDRRVARSGPWSLTPDYLRASFRSGVLRLFRTFTLGFRLAEDK